MVRSKPAWNTRSAASGSPAMLASATGETFPGARKVPPMNTTFFKSRGSCGSRSSAFARFVIRARVTRVSSPGCSRAIRAMKSQAGSSRGRWGEGGSSTPPMPLGPWMWGSGPFQFPASGSVAPTATGTS